MHQQLAQIFVTTFADPQQPWFAAGRHPPRYQTKPGSEAAPTSKRGGTADRGRQSRGVQHADPGDACQAAGGFIGLGLGSEFTVERLDTTVQVTPFRSRVLTN